LNQAAEYGHTEVVKRLFEAGADIHNKGGADKTPIMNAAFAGHVQIVQLFIGFLFTVLVQFETLRVWETLRV